MNMFKMKRRVLFFVIVYLLFVTSVSGQTFKAGIAVRKVTPEPLIPVSGGVGTPAPAKIKKGELFTRALVLEKGNTRIAIVSIDNLGWPAALGDQTRKLVTGIAPGNIIIGCTHTHSAPDAYGFADESGQTAVHMEYLNWCVKQMADAINEAISKLEPAVLKTVVGEAKGKIAYNYYAPILYDPRCGVIQLISREGTNKGKPIATLVNYAIHPEIIGPAQEILSPDLCGPLYDRIEKNGGGTAMFMGSTQGGMVTADNRKENGGLNRTWEECIRIGELLADEALRIINNAEVQENPGLYCTAKTIQFPVESELMRYVLKSSPLNFSVDNDYNVSAQVNLVNLGEAQILTIPGEALPNIGYYLKRNMKGSQPFLFGNTNDAYAYMLTKIDFNSFKRYDYVSQTSLGEMTGEIYMEEALKMVNSNPGPDGLDDTNRK
jgi:hypothetical protein